MTFSSLIFLFVFFPITFILYAVCKNDFVRNIILAAASIIFYAFGEPFAVILMVISIFFNYILGLGAAGKDEKKCRLYVLLAAILNIGLLIAYKYTPFFASTFNSITGLSVPVPDIRLPIGISFFTFQGLSYVIDVYRDKKSVQTKFFNVLLYISFFPQLIAGPIVRYQDIEKQLHVREFTADRVSRGITRFLFGLGKKVLIANQMGIVADNVFSYKPDTVGTLPSWIGAVCYTLQIFFDFSGYSDMAIGLGCIFGFDFRENFNYPFTASSIQEFWRRWHISLSTWFKEYVYIPLGGNRKGKVRTDVNKLIVFFLTGFWHGANFTFIVWGMIHGICQLLENHNIIPARKKWFKPFGHVYVMLVTILAFILFRADSLSQGFRLIANMFTPHAGLESVASEIYTFIKPLFKFTFVFAVLFSTPVCRMIKDKFTAGKYAVKYQYAEYACSLLIYALCILSLISSRYNPFIYFRF